MRQFIASSYPDKQGQLSVCGKDFKYLSQVLRLIPGDVISVRFQDGTLKLMEVIRVLSKQLILKVSSSVDKIDTSETGVSANEIENSNQTKITLFQFLPKSTKMDLIIRQAVECGVNKIFPILGEFSVNVDSKERMIRWNRIIKEARQQSGSPVATEISETCNINQALDYWNSINQCKIGFVLHEAAISDKNIFEVLRTKPVIPSEIVIVIGCEGGISENELNLLSKSDFELIHFKTNVLRAETAALYGIAAIQNAVMEFESWHINE